MARRHTQQARENAAREAAKRLRHHGISDLNGYFMLREEPVAWLADIARHINSLDPIEIGAAALLEASGYQRANEQLSLQRVLFEQRLPTRRHAIERALPLGQL
ncbi:MAG: hypothetical protein ACLP50_04615 [Solirubrobacteraceae bacterium]